MRETIIEILEEIKAGVDYENESGIISRGILTSLNVFALINALSNEFDVQIGADKLLPENFDSVNAIENLIKLLQDED